MKDRNNGIDFARGIAIQIMLFANACPYIFDKENYPILIRLLFSSAAPIFIYLHGYSLALSLENNTNIKRIILRGIQILIIAIFIDTIIWQIVPFQTMDVLYLIAFSSFILVVSRKLNKISLLTISLLIILIHLYFLKFNYRFEMNEIKIRLDTTFSSQRADYKRILLDGWFPLIPWLSFSIIGFLSQKPKLLTFKQTKIIFKIGFFIFLISIILFCNNKFTLNNLRNGYTEIFYPVTTSFLFYSLGLISVIVFLIKRNYLKRNFLTEIGRISLPIYLVHSLLIKLFILIFELPNPSYNYLFKSLLLIIYNLLILIISLIIIKNLDRIKNNKLKTLKWIFGF